MQSKPQGTPPEASQLPEFATPVARKPLVLLRDTERSLRVKTVAAIGPILPEQVALNLGEASLVADESLEQLAAIDLESITDADLKPARMQMGMLFLAFGALAMAFLSMCLYLLNPGLNASEQIHHYWHQYVWFVGLGISGLFMLGREAMRPLADEAEFEDGQDDFEIQTRRRRE